MCVVNGFLNGDGPFPLRELIGLAASTDASTRAAALKYFFDNYATRYADYDPNDFSNVAYVPAMKGNTRCLAKPHEVCMARLWEIHA